MKFSKIIITKPGSFEDFRGELYTLYKDADYNSLYINHGKV
jgi:hypothetical protein